MKRFTAMLLALTMLLGACGGGGGGDEGRTAVLPDPDPRPDPDPDPPSPATPATALAAKLGRGNRLLFGLGGRNEVDAIEAQGLRLDVLDRYLPDLPGGSWVDYNSPRGEYVRVVTDQADRIGAMPMFTLYQMAVNGDGDLSILSNRAQMQTYWEHVTLLFDRLRGYGRPVLVNFEPDFWGYLELQADRDPRNRFAHVRADEEGVVAEVGLHLP